jgi:threonine dehydrogenase-like Zn-dependent dehydrogenase
MIEHVLQLIEPHKLEWVARQARALEPFEVRIRTLYSGISAGTELTQYRGTNPYLEKRWDASRKLFVTGSPGQTYPLEGFGYEQVGEVTELGSGVTKLRIGQVVWGSWNHRTQAVLHEDIAAPRVLQRGVNPTLGMFARIGAIALNPVHDGEIRVGDVVAVFGLGVPGLIAAQLAQLNGGEVIAVDGVDRRLELARTLGLNVLDFRVCDVAERIKAMTNNRGADVSLEITGSYRALHDAIRATAYNSRVVAAGFFQGDGIGLRLGEEFHHNRVQIVCSQTSGVSPSLDHRWDRLRLEQTVMRLAARGSLQLEPLVSHVMPYRDAAQAFRMLDTNPAEAVQVVLEFGSEP